MRCAEGIPAERRPGPLQHQHRGDPGHRLRRDGAPSEARSPAIVAADPNVSSYSSNVGGGPRGGALNTGKCRSTSSPAHERTLSVDEIIEELRPKLAQIPGIRIFMVEPAADQPRRPAVARAACTSSRCRTPTPTSSIASAPLLEAKLRELPGLRRRAAAICRCSNPQVQIDMDRDQIVGPRPDRRARSRTRCTAPTARGRCRRFTRPTISTRSSCSVAPEFQNDPAALSMLYVRLVDAAS